MKCEVEDCVRNVQYAGLCGMHYKRRWRHGDVTKTYTPTRDQPKALCSVDGCKDIVDSKDMCKVHYLRFHRYGRTHTIVNRGSGFTMNGAGYIMLWIDGVWKYEHIYLAEKALGKPLPKGAVVHHMNKKPWDNETPLNLIVCPDQAYHLLLHRRMMACE